jgi:hypothetical protein
MHAGTYVQAHSHYSVFVRVCAFSVCVCAFACESVSVCVCACECTDREQQTLPTLIPTPIHSLAHPFTLTRTRLHVRPHTLHHPSITRVSKKEGWNRTQEQLPRGSA